MTTPYLFSSVDFLPKVGGVSDLAANLSQELSQRYDQPSVLIAPAGSRLPTGSAKLDLYEDLHSEPMLRSGRYCEFEDERIVSLFQRICRFRTPERILLWHPFYYGVAATSVARRLGVRSSVFIHGTELTSQFPGLIDGESVDPEKLSPLSLSARLFQTLQSVDQVYTNSQFTAGLVQLAIPDVPVIAVGAGIRTDLFDQHVGRSPDYSVEIRRSRRTQLGLNDRPTFICTGRFVPHKNQRSVLQLLQAVADAQCIFIGDGPLLEDVRAKAAHMGLADRAIFEGRVDDTRKWDLLHASDIGLLPSKHDQETGGYEGFGIALLEYAIAGCLPAATASCGTKELVEEDNIAIPLRLDADQLACTADQLTSAIHSQGLIQTGMSKARNIIQSKYLWSRIADRIEATG